mmetsp:Transcript_17969/g.20114  ORF Transcript_17969/g.20114 Transcript_17969/m.20114 type:complete len:136 (-) Transcript_17969:125-532(-)
MNPEGTKLTVVVGGYGTEYEPIISKNDMTCLPIISSYHGTRVIVYDIDESSLTELSQSNIHGYHVNSYMVGSNLHIVTKMTLNTWEYLSNPLQRWTFEDMTDDEYVRICEQTHRSCQRRRQSLPNPLVNIRGPDF